MYVFVWTALTIHDKYTVIVLVHSCGTTLKVVQSAIPPYKDTNCGLVTFSLYELSPMYTNKTTSFTASSQDGDTALMIASSKGHSGVVKKLLQAGATVNTTDNVSKVGGDLHLVGPVIPLPQTFSPPPLLALFLS